MRSQIIYMLSIIINPKKQIHCVQTTEGSERERERERIGEEENIVRLWASFERFLQRTDTISTCGRPVLQLSVLPQNVLMLELFLCHS
jgi:hypothetical protein